MDFSCSSTQLSMQAQQDRKFDETIDVVFRLGTDPRRGDQQVRGAVNLPHGTGKNVRVCVFADGEAAEIARTSGIVSLFLFSSPFFAPEQDIFCASF